MVMSEKEYDEKCPHRVYRTNDGTYIVVDLKRPIINSWVFILSFKNKEDAFKYATTLNNSENIAAEPKSVLKKFTKKKNEDDFFEIRDKLEDAESYILDYISSDRSKELIRNLFSNIYSILLNDYNKKIDMDKVKKEADELGILVPDVLSLEPCLAKDIVDAVKSCDLDFEKIAEQIKKDKEEYENYSSTKRFR